MNVWQTGDVITAEKLNDLESRAGGGVLIVTFSDTAHGSGYDKYLLSDVLWDDAVAAFKAGRTIVFHSPGTVDGVERSYGVYETWWTPTGFGTYEGDIFYSNGEQSSFGGLTYIVKDETTGLIAGNLYVD